MMRLVSFKPLRRENKRKGVQETRLVEIPLHNPLRACILMRFRCLKITEVSLKNVTKAQPQGIPAGSGRCFLFRFSPRSASPFLMPLLRRLIQSTAPQA
jgi:hypothetical protein